MLGLPAELAPRGAPLEQLHGGRSLGLITLAPEYQLIRWINVRTEPSGDDDDYFTDYMVPDPRLQDRDLSKLDVRCRARGGLWPFRGPSKIEWQGNDLGLGIPNRLNNDDALVGPLLARHFAGRPLRIRASHQHGLWTLTVPGGDTTVLPHLFGVDWPQLDVPQAEQWHCYQSLARHLLQTPIVS